MSFTDQRRRVATIEECQRSWGGGKRFRCYLCAHRFEVGDGWRWVYSSPRGLVVDGQKYGVTNFLTCDNCDGPDVLDLWVKRNEEFNSDKFWALR